MPNVWIKAEIFDYAGCPHGTSFCPEALFSWAVAPGANRKGPPIWRQALLRFLLLRAVNVRKFALSRFLKG
jgi:hypothetical protein